MPSGIFSSRYVYFESKKAWLAFVNEQDLVYFMYDQFPRAIEFTKIHEYNKLLKQFFRSFFSNQQKLNIWFDSYS